MARYHPTKADGLRRGQPAPDFTLASVDGGQVALRNFRGRWAVLVFLRYLG
jgi:peroxiredoxin